MFGNQVLIGLGEISFSAYLIHAPILATLALVAKKLRLGEAGLLPRLTLVASIPGLVLGAAVLLWRLVEVPSGRFLQPSSGAEAPRSRTEPGASSKLVFWLAMVVAMTFTETAADFLSGTVALGYGLSCALLVTAGISVLVARIEVPRFGHLAGWGLILCIGMAGTSLSDFLDTSVGLGDVNAFIALALTLLVVRPASRLIPTAGLARKAGPLINLLTLLLVGALCTALADILSETLGLQNSAGFLPLLAGVTCVAAAGVWTRLPTRLLFWAAFVLLRPLGATFGEALMRSHAEGGFQFGAGPASLMLMSAMIVLIPIAGQHFFDPLRSSEREAPGQASA